MIEYKTHKDLPSEQLERLFLSVNWSSGKYPEKLKIALNNSHHVISAWQGDRLIGLMNALSDTIMTAYFHYLLVDPEFQGLGIGKTLVRQMLDYYEDFARKVLISVEDQQGFYEHCGFVYHDDKKVMFITSLET